jgi:hypothetical protein
MLTQLRRREDLVRIARSEMESRLKYVVTAYAHLFPVPLKEININLRDGIVISCVPEDKKL